MKETWEYRSVMIRGPFNQYCLKELNELGRDGYELIEINDGGVALLKRRVLELSDDIRAANPG